MTRLRMLLLSTLLLTACKPPNGPEPADEYDRLNKLPPLAQAQGSLAAGTASKRGPHGKTEARPPAAEIEGGADSSLSSPSAGDTGEPPTMSPVVHVQPITGTVMETMDVTQYTYMLVDTGSEEFWTAAQKLSVKVGDRVRLSGYSRVQNIHSRELDRSFDEILFVMDARVLAPIAAADSGPASERPAGAAPLPADPHAALNAAAGNPHAPDPHAGLASHAGDPHAGLGLNAPAVDSIRVEKLPDGLTVEQLYSGKEALAGKPVRLRGQVVKVNNDILGRNWLHLRDGSGGEGTNDITVTSAQTAKVGDVVVVEGTLNVDKDLGSGYLFPVIVEDATFSN